MTERIPKNELIMEKPNKGIEEKNKDMEREKRTEEEQRLMAASEDLENMPMEKFIKKYDGLEKAWEIVLEIHAWQKEKMEAEKIDSLTGLKKRRGCMERGKDLIRQKLENEKMEAGITSFRIGGDEFVVQIVTKREEVLLITGDMAFLKYFNDAFGHDAGDKAIIEVSTVFERAGEEVNLGQDAGECAKEFVGLVMKKFSEAELPEGCLKKGLGIHVDFGIASLKEAIDLYEKIKNDGRLPGRSRGRSGDILDIFFKLADRRGMMNKAINKLKNLCEKSGSLDGVAFRGLVGLSLRGMPWMTEEKIQELVDMPDKRKQWEEIKKIVLENALKEVEIEDSPDIIEAVKKEF